MKTKILLTILIFLVIFTCCHSGSSNSSKNSSSYEATKMTLEEQEKNNPTSFLTVQATYRKNLIGEWVIKGTISNSATVATFKDVVLKINYYSKTESLIGSEQQVVYDYFPKGKSKDFKIKTSGYNAAKSIGVKIESASSSN